MELDHILVTDLEVWVDCGRLALWQAKKEKKYIRQLIAAF